VVVATLICCAVDVVFVLYSVLDCEWYVGWSIVFFFQAEDGIRDWSVTGVQTCALPILLSPRSTRVGAVMDFRTAHQSMSSCERKIGRASCRERGKVAVVFGAL